MLIDPELLEAYYGYGICKFKEGNPKEAVEHLTVAINKYEKKNHGHKNPRDVLYDGVCFRYLRSLCHRVMGNFQLS